MLSKRLAALAAAALTITALGACSAESLAEFGIEQAFDGEGEFDLDLDFGDNGHGGFNISTDEGDFSFNLDGESGGIMFDTDEGDGVISFDEDGIVFDTDEGDGVISFDEDGIVFDTDAGDGVISFDEDGIVFDTDQGDGAISFEENGVNFGTEDGSAFFGSGDIPDNWPADIGVPATTDPDQTFFTVFDTPDGSSMTGIFQHDPAEPYGARVQATLEATGWTSTFEASTSEGAQIQYTKGSNTAVVFYDDMGFASVSFVIAG